MEKPQRERKRRNSAQEKSLILAAYRQSGQTQQAFCQAQGICVATLATWLKRAREAGPVGRAGGLVELPVTVRSSGEIVIEVGAGLNVRAPVGVSVAWLCELIGALRCGG